MVRLFHFENANNVVASTFVWSIVFLSFLFTSLTNGQHQTENNQVATLRPVAAKVVAKENEAGVLFSENGKPVLQYQAKPKDRNGTHRRANYVHPLYDLAGNVLTEDFPGDHLHHRGIFWAWHQVNVGGKRAGDAWMTQDFDWVVGELATSVLKTGAAKMNAEIQWKSPDVVGKNGKPLPIINESTSIVVHSASNQCRLIDFEIKLLAAQPKVTIGGSENVKGYGGFSVRIVQPQDLEFLTAKGKVKAINTQLDCGNWVDLVGTYFPKQQSDSSSTDPNSKSGVAILVHPSSAGFPQKWILRSKVKSMQNPVFPGKKAVPVSQTEPTVLRYRLVIHNTEMSVDALTKLSKEYGLVKF